VQAARIDVGRVVYLQSASRRIQTAPWYAPSSSYFSHRFFAHIPLRPLCCTRRASPTAGRRCGRCSPSWAHSTGGQQQGTASDFDGHLHVSRWLGCGIRGHHLLHCIASQAHEHAFPQTCFARVELHLCIGTSACPNCLPPGATPLLPRSERRCVTRPPPTALLTMFNLSHPTGATPSRPRSERRCATRLLHTAPSCSSGWISARRCWPAPTCTGSLRRR